MALDLTASLRQTSAELTSTNISDIYKSIIDNPLTDTSETCNLVDNMFSTYYGLNWPSVKSEYNFATFFVSYLSLTTAERESRRITLKQARKKGLKALFVVGEYTETKYKKIFTDTFANLVSLKNIKNTNRNCFKIKLLYKKKLFLNKVKFYKTTGLFGVNPPLSIISLNRWGGLNSEGFTWQHTTENGVNLYEQTSTKESTDGDEITYKKVLIEKISLNEVEKQDLLLYIEMSIEMFEKYLKKTQPSDDGYYYIASNDLTLLYMFKSFLEEQTLEFEVYYG